MGAVSFSIDAGLVVALKSALPLEVFVETGTWEGDSVERVRDLFREIRSVEVSRPIYEGARQRFAGLEHVELSCCSSVEALTRWIPELRTRSVLYFLDAHWCAGAETATTATMTSQCPLLEELHAIGTLNDESVIIIDDARLFLAPPPAPHDDSHWADLISVLHALRAGSATHRLMVLNDTLVWFPPAAADVVRDYARRANTDLLAVMGKIRDYDNLRSQFDQIVAQLQEKEQAIHELTRACEERDARLRLLAPPPSPPGLATNASASEVDIAARLERLEQGNAAILEALQAVGFGSPALPRIQATVDAPFMGATQALLQEICDARLKVIKEQQAALQRMRRFSLTYRVAQFFSGYPRIGQLCHHPGIPMRSWGQAPAPDYSRRDPWPLISIVTPSYGQAAFIGQTLDSVLEQNYPRLEYFVQDGGSSDGTVEILESYSDRLSGWVSEPDGGQSQAINLGFARTQGEIMAWLNSDDLLLPGALAYVADYFARHPEVDVVYGHRVLIDEEGQEIGRWILPGHDDEALSWADFIPQETLFWRRSIWEKAGGRIDESFRFAMDWDLLLRFRKAGARMRRLPRFLGAFRIHHAQKTSAAINEVGMQEMDRLRVRELGHAPSGKEIHKALVPYLLRHMLTDIAARIRYRLGMSG